MNNELIKFDDRSFGFPATVTDPVADALQDPTIVKEFGKNGKLSDKQKALILADALKAKERELQTLKETHRQEISTLAKIWKFMGGPIWENPRAFSTKAEADTDEKPFRLKTIFTVRNVIGGGAVLIVAFGFLLTNLTLNWKEKAEAYEKDLKALAEENRQLAGEAQTEKTRADTAEHAVSGVQGAGADVQKQLLATIDALSKETGEAARSTAAGAERTYQKLYESEKRERLDWEKKYEKLVAKSSTTAPQTASR